MLNTYTLSQISLTQISNSNRYYDSFEEWQNLTCNKKEKKEEEEKKGTTLLSLVNIIIRPAEETLDFYNAAYFIINYPPRYTCPGERGGSSEAPRKQFVHGWKRGEKRPVDRHLPRGENRGEGGGKEDD